MSNFDNLFNEIINIDLCPVNTENEDQLQLLLTGINLAASASDNDLWDNDTFNIVCTNFPSRKWYFLTLDDDKIGTVSYRLIKDNIIFLSCFAIFQEFQGNGLGYNAMNTIINYFKQQFNNNNQDLKFQLNVAKINKKAFNLYKKCNFKCIKNLPTKFVMQLKFN